jgi:hypothetical protein
LRPATVPNRLPYGCYGPFQGIVADKLVSPQRLQQFLAGDHPGTMLHQICQKLKDLRLELYQLASPVQFVGMGIERIRAKAIPHGQRPPPVGRSHSATPDYLIKFHAISISVLQTMININNSIR